MKHVQELSFYIKKTKKKSKINKYIEVAIGIYRHIGISEKKLLTTVYGTQLGTLLALIVLVIYVVVSIITC